MFREKLNNTISKLGIWNSCFKFLLRKQKQKLPIEMVEISKPNYRCLNVLFRAFEKSSYKSFQKFHEKTVENGEIERCGKLTGKHFVDG